MADEKQEVLPMEHEQRKNWKQQPVTRGGAEWP